MSFLLTSFWASPGWDPALPGVPTPVLLTVSFPPLVFLPVSVLFWWAEGRRTEGGNEEGKNLASYVLRHTLIWLGSLVPFCLHSVPCTPLSVQSSLNTAQNHRRDDTGVYWPRDKLTVPGKTTLGRKKRNRRERREREVFRERDGKDKYNNNNNNSNNFCVWTTSYLPGNVIALFSQCSFDCRLFLHL